MAVEAKRGCGYRKVGGIYLVGDGLWAECDRLPLPVGSCPVCNQGIHFPRAPMEVNPAKLFALHAYCTEERPDLCHVCQPDNGLAYLLGVGEKFYTPQTFMTEAHTMGVSKRIPAIPKNLELGKTWVYLVHKKAMFDQDTGDPQMAVFCAFKPQRIEMPIWQSELTPEKQQELEKRGITPVPIPDGDVDHA